MLKKYEGGRSQGWMQTVAKDSNSVTIGWHNLSEEGGGRGADLQNFGRE